MNNIFPNLAKRAILLRVMSKRKYINLEMDSMGKLVDFYTAIRTKILFKKILSFILFFNFLILLVILYDGGIDDYAPQHSGIAYNIISGSIDGQTEYHMEHAGGFYSLIAVIILLTNLKINLIPILPFTILPYGIIFFALIYSISGRNIFLSILLSMVIISSPISGSHQVYIWMHGLGDVLLYTFFLLIYILYTNDAIHKEKYLIFLIIILSVSIVFMSYNTSYRLLLFSTIFVFINVYYLKLNKLKLRFLTFLINNLLIVLLVRFGLSDFFYEVFLPNNVIDSSIDYAYVAKKFFLQYLGMNVSETKPLMQYAFAYPDIIANSWIFKYVIYAIVITAAIFLIYKKQKKDRLVDINSLLFITLFFLTIIYFISRFLVGQFAISEIFGIFWISIIIVNEKFDKTKYYKYIIPIVLLTLITLNITNLIISSEYDLTNKGKYEYLELSANWIYEFGKDYILVPDILTYGYYYNVYSTKECFKMGCIDPRMLKIEYIEKLYKGDIIDKNFNIAINYYVGHNNVQNWNNLIPFKKIKGKIENNPSLKTKIYDSKYMSIY